MPNIGEPMEFKGHTELPVHCTSSSLRCERGMVRCPSGTGFGVTIEADFLNRATKLEAGA